MRKFFLVFWNEYKRHVLRKRFLVALLSVPLLVGLMIGIGFLSVALEFDSRPIGYVDAPEIFADPQLPPPPEKKPLFPDPEIKIYNSEAEARTALDANEVQAYFVLSPDYLNNGSATMFSLENPGDNVTEDFSNFLSYNLLLHQPQEVQQRLNEGFQVTIRSADGSREVSNPFATIIMPFVTGLIFIIVINISGGYLLQAVVEEKENRTMEIMVTSVTPGQLMAGKTVGNLGVGITQLVIWIVFIWIAFIVGQIFFPDLAELQLDFSFLPLMAIVLLPAFILVGALMATLGATATEAREAQQLAGIFTLPIALPYWFITPIIMRPNGSLAVALSLFPLTAPVTLPVRAAFATIPVWQVVLSILLLVLSAAGALWLSGRAFRLGMLRYGKKMTLKELFGGIRAAGGSRG